MLSWAVWFKFLPNKVIANTCLFILTSFSKQSASWKVPEICDLWALSTDSPKTYSVNKYMYTASSSYSFDWGGEKRKRPYFPFLLHQLSEMETLHEKMLGLFRYFLPAPMKKFLFPPLADMLTWAVSFKFLPNEVIASTCLFILTSFSKQSASWRRYLVFVNCVQSTDSRKTYQVNKYMYTGSSSYSFDWGGGGGEETEKTQFPFSVASAFQNGNATWKDVGSFPLFPPSPTEKIIISPLADMLSWAVSFKFLLNKVIANTCLFILTSFSKQSSSRKVLEICELCALSTDSRKTYSVNKYMYTGTGSYGFDWGGRNGKDPIYLFCCISLPKWKHYMKRYWVFSVISSQPTDKIIISP